MTDMQDGTRGSRFWNENTAALQPYIPGEQPRDGENPIKINTNECPYPPSPHVLAAIRETADDRIRLYPSPDAAALRAALADALNLHGAGMDADNVYVGNGSDEVLAVAFKTFFDAKRLVSFPDITYSFYTVYCNLFGIPAREIPLRDDFTVDTDAFRGARGGVVLANPNAPTSLALTSAQIEEIVQAHPDDVVLVDEAYVDFGAQSVVPLTAVYPNLLVVQTMSKSRALAGMRVGFAIGSRELIAGMERVRNSFNSYPIDRVALAAGVAAVRDRDYYRDIVRKIVATRERTETALTDMHFTVLPSRTNFLFAAPPVGNARELAEFLRAQHILVRHFDKPRIRAYLRVTVGTDAEMEQFVAAVRRYMAQKAVSD